MVGGSGRTIELTGGGEGGGEGGNRGGVTDLFRRVVFLEAARV